MPISLTVLLCKWGLLSDRPVVSADNLGMRYYATDNGLLYRSDGTSWGQFFSLADVASRLTLIGPNSGSNPFTTLVIPDSAKLMYVRIWGAGGGGSACGTGNQVDGSGGGGGSYHDFLVEIEATSIYRARAGVSGVGGLNLGDDGGDGAATVLQKDNEAIVEAKGGKGGTIPDPSDPGYSLGGAGGSSIPVGIFVGGEKGSNF